MEQVVRMREMEQEIRERIESEFAVIMKSGGQAGFTRELWKEVFPAVSEAYLDYYYEYEAKENMVFAVQGEELLSMLHLMPCPVAMRRNPPLPGLNRLPCMADVVRVDTNIISVAATKEAYRGRGCMGRILSGALAYQREMKIPFCMVSSEEDTFFSHFGFHYIYDEPRYELNTERISEEMLRRAAEGAVVPLGQPNVTLTVADRSSLLTLAHFVNANLCRQYKLFNIRSAVYYEHFQRELCACGGNLYQIREGGRLRGYFARVEDREDTIREAVFENASDLEQYFYTASDKKPALMARVVNLQEMLRHVSSDGSVTIAIRLKDPVIAENDGIFIWYLNENGSRMERVEEPENGRDASMRPEVTATVGEFTAFLFEYIRLKQNMKFDSIYLSGPVWINGKF